MTRKVEKYTELQKLCIKTMSYQHYLIPSFLPTNNVDELRNNKNVYFIFFLFCQSKTIYSDKSFFLGYQNNQAFLLGTNQSDAALGILLILKDYTAQITSGIDQEKDDFFQSFRM